MITSTYAWRSKRIIRWTVIVSLIVHLLLAIAYFALQPWVVRALSRIEPPSKQQRQPDEIVTISNARDHALKAHVRIQSGHRPASQHRPVVAVVPKPKTVAERPRVVVVPRPKPVVTPVPEPPSKALHELAKAEPSAPPEPKKTVKQKVVTEVPSAPPATPKPHHDEPTSAPDAKQVAVAGPPAQHSSKELTPEQLAQINTDLAKSIAADRAENNPLNTRSLQTPAATSKRFAFQLSGADGRMRGSQGLCEPIKSWESDGWNYYYVTCNVAFSDGMSDVEAVPWPVRYRPNQDPFVLSVRQVPVPGPLPGWTLPAGAYVGEGVKAYARTFGYNL